MPSLFGSLWRRAARHGQAVVTGLLVLVSLGCSALAIYRDTAVEHEQMTDTRLRHLSETVLSLVEAELAINAQARSSANWDLQLLQTRSPGYLYQVWTSDGSMLLSNSARYDAAPIVPLDRLGIASVDVAGKAHRAISLRVRDDSLIVQAAVPVHEQAVHVGWITGYHVALLLPSLLLVSVTAWLVLRRVSRSMNRLASDLRQCDPLRARAVSAAPHSPTTRPVEHALGDLFDRISYAVSIERSLSSIAAHEIRSPLAGIRAQAQVARTAQSPAELDEALGSLMQGVDRAARMLDQVLDLSRVNAMEGHVESLFQCFDLSRSGQDVIEELEAQARAKRIALSARFDASHHQGIDSAVAILLRNLVSNALLYTPVGGRVEVRTRMRLAETVLTVDDSGPGIPADRRDQAFERFNRLGLRDSAGVGLGLWIVKRVVDLHGATVHLLDSPLGGLRVEVVFAHRIAAVMATA